MFFRNTIRLRRICDVKKAILLVLVANFFFLSFTLHTRLHLPYNDLQEEYVQELSSNQSRQLTVVLQRRLGDMMFEAASGYAIANHSHMQFVLPCEQIAVQELKELFVGMRDIPCSSNASSTFTDVKLSSWHQFDPSAFKLQPRGNVVLSGYLQSFKYFQSRKHGVKQLFQFSPQIEAASAVRIKNATAARRAKTIVGVHVHRRERHHQPLAKQLVYVLPGADYYEAAMSHFRKKYDGVLFVVLSDDVEWSVANIRRNDVVFVNSTSISADMCMLARMDHVVIGVGTTGWWSAFLNDGQVIYFRNFLPPKFEFRADDYFPKEWFSLGF